MKLQKRLNNTSKNIGESPQATLKENFQSSEDDLNEHLISNNKIRKERNLVHRLWKKLDEQYIQPRLIHNFDQVQEEKKKIVNEYIENQKFKLDSHLPAFVSNVNAQNDTPERKNKHRESSLQGNMHPIEEAMERESHDNGKEMGQKKERNSGKYYLFIGKNFLILKEKITINIGSLSKNFEISPGEK